MFAESDTKKYRYGEMSREQEKEFVEWANQQARWEGSYHPILHPHRPK